MALQDRISRERLALVGLCALCLAGATYAIVKGQRRPSPVVFTTTPPATAQLNKPSVSTGVTVHVAGAVRKAGLYHLIAEARVDDAVRAAGGPTAEADLDQINLAAKLIDGSQLFVPSKKARAAAAQEVGATARPHKEIAGEIAPPYQGGSTAPYQISIVPDKVKAGSEASPPATSPSSQGATSDTQAPPPQTEQAHPPRAKKQPHEININTATAEDFESLPGIGPATAKKILDYRSSHGGFKTIDEIVAVKGIGPKKFEALRPYLKV